MDRRKHARFKINGKVFVYYDHRSPKIAEIADISEDGVSFLHTGISESVNERFEMEIILPDSVRFMEKLPCRTVSDSKIPLKENGNQEKRRCGVQFVDLADEQKEKLDYFIETYCWRVDK